MLRLSSKRVLRHILRIAIMAALLAPAASPAARAWSWQLQGVAGSGPKLYQQDALTSAVEDFLIVDEDVEWPDFSFFGGGSSGGSGSGSASTSASGSGGSSGSQRLELDGDDIARGSDIPYRQYPGVYLGLRLEGRQDLAPGLRLLPSLSAGIGRDKYHLPEGALPLTDPIDITFVYAALVPELALEHRFLSGRAGEIAGRLSGGVEMTLVETSVTSDLLDVEHRSRHALAYGGLALVLRPAILPAELHLGAQVHDMATNPNFYWALAVRF